MKKLIILASGLLISSTFIVGCDNGAVDERVDLRSPRETLPEAGIKPVSLYSPKDCRNLLAGKSIIVGEVCLYWDYESLLKVDLKVYEPWLIDEAHLWAGESLDSLPVNRSSNPIPGHFPYSVSSLSGVDELSFSVSLSGLTSTCQDSIHLAVHLAISSEGAGGVTVSESAWGEGDRITARGNWATSMLYTLPCQTEEDEENDTPFSGCESAFSFGDKTLIEVGVTSSRWGWQKTLLETSLGLTLPIYSGAGQNNLDNATHVGNLVIDYDGLDLVLSGSFFHPFVVVESHVHAAASEVETVAVGQWAHKNSHHQSPAESDVYALSGFDDAFPLYVAYHAVVCSEQ